MINCENSFSTDIIFGNGTHHEVGARIKKYSSNILLLYGGGSVLDTAKAAALGTPYDGNVWDFFCGKTTIEKALPVATILTIPGTGSETSPNVVISNAETKEKIGIFDTVLMPKFSILDPELCVTIPKSQECHGMQRIIPGAGEAGI